MKKIRVRLEDRAYDILIGRGLIDNCGRIFKKLGLGPDAVIVTNRRVASLYGRAIERSLERNGFTAHFEFIADSERAKSLSVASRLLNRLSRYDIDKRVFIVALGGGVVGDLAGFVASVYKRGVPYVQVPTTLLAQVDSSIGGKTAVDLDAAKNLVGSFYQPRAVISDVSVIRTLSPRQIRNGLAETIKYGVIKDAALFGYLESNLDKIMNSEVDALEYIVSKSAKIKAGIVARDEFDRKRVRAVLNYGHTIGHAIEAAAGYSGRYSHGEAIAIGMVAANRMAYGLGLMKASEAERVERLIKRAGLPVSVKGLAISGVYKAHLHDKKFTGGKNRFILAGRIGSSKVIDDVADPVIRNVLKSCVKN